MGTFNLMKLNKVKYFIKEHPETDEITELRYSLRTFNQNMAHITDYSSVLIGFRDEQDNLTAGVYGQIAWNWLYIDLLWVRADMRGRKLGTRLMNEVEEYARSKGIFRFRLSTSDFQAPEFYKKLDYEVFGELTDLPPGHTTYFMFKKDH